jgi:hypothetical protein
MKRKRFGRKVQNWHRPLGPTELGRRYRKRRHDAPEVVEEGRCLPFEPDYIDDFWDCYDPVEWEWSADRDADPREIKNDLRYVQLRSVSASVLHPRRSLIPPELRDRLASPTEAEAESAAADDEVLPVASRIENRLAAYLDLLWSLDSGSFDTIAAGIRDAVADSRDIEAVRAAAIRSGSTDFAHLVLLFAPFWVRKPKDFLDSDDRRMLDHLFVVQKVPAFLYSEWFRADDAPRFKWLCWFILSAQGGSLKRAASYFNWRISPRFQHHLQDLPAEMSPTEACILAEVKRLGGSLADFCRLMADPGFVVDPTKAAASEVHSSFWRDTVRWLIAHGSEITDDESRAILAWAMHEFTEARVRETAFSWKGRRTRTTVERATEYLRTLERPWSKYRWRGHGWNWEPGEAVPGGWSFVELTDGEQLHREGNRMHHCVSSYAGRCAAGHSAIVSLKRYGVPSVTIEVNPTAKQVVQVRGEYNRAADNDEMLAVFRWLTDVVQGNRSNG